MNIEHKAGSISTNVCMLVIVMISDNFQKNHVILNGAETVINRQTK